MKLRKANLNDISNIWSLIQTSFNDAQSPYLATGQFGFDEYLKDTILNPNSKELLVATVDEQFAGFVDVTLSATSQNFLTRISVAAAFRGQGLAKEIMRKMADRYESNRKWALDVSSENSSAIKLYKALDFKIVSTSSWIGKTLPISSPAKQSLPPTELSVDKNYRRFGFTRVRLDDQELNIAGTAVKFNNFDDLSDSNWIAKVQSRFPEVNRAYSIIEEGFDFEGKQEDLFEIARIHRMFGSL